ncbi:unnamed protein product [Moneuplotes crassus]|uniref:Transmembrane protein n=1 Tax=Euplotes crassus TaxID=5936 RepID=A0AAD1Y6A6_EUPCR|nr:unnamed protein product [Moneuplotes crassus]
MKSLRRQSSKAKVCSISPKPIKDKVLGSICLSKRTDDLYQKFAKETLEGDIIREQRACRRVKTFNKKTVSFCKENPKASKTMKNLSPVFTRDAQLSPVSEKQTLGQQRIFNRIWANFCSTVFTLSSYFIQSLFIEFPKRCESFQIFMILTLVLIILFRNRMIKRGYRLENKNKGENTDNLASLLQKLQSLQLVRNAKQGLTSPTKINRNAPNFISLNKREIAKALETRKKTARSPIVSRDKVHFPKITKGRMRKACKSPLPALKAIYLAQK